MFLVSYFMFNFKSDNLLCREKLEKWKAEKAKKMMQNKLSTTKGPQQIMSLAKPSTRPVNSLPLKRPLKSSISTNLQRPKLPSGKVLNRRTTMTLVSGTKAAAQQAKGGNPLPSKRPRLSAAQAQDSLVTRKPPASRRSTGGPRRGLGRIQKILQTDDARKNEAGPTDSPEEPVEEHTEGEKENSETVENKSDTTKSDDPFARAESEEQQPKTVDATTGGPAVPALILSTPLSHNTQFSMRQIIANLASKSSGANQATENKPVSGFHTTPVVAVHSLSVACEPNNKQLMDHQVVSQQEQGGEAEKFTDKTFCVEPDAAQLKSAGSRSAGTQSKRESLSAQFRKQKSQSAVSAVRSQSHASAARKSVCGKVAAPESRSKSQQPSRSILKRKSCFPGDTDFSVGVSPFLSGVRKSSSNPDQTSTAVVKSASASDHTQEEGEKQGGHVTFAVAAHQEGVGANFRKTPAAVSKERKTQESVRAKLNEWRASKAHTPNIRHAGCFHTDCHSAGRPTPRSQVKPSITVEQLSKQENTLVQEELKKNLLTHFNAAPSPKPPSGKFMVTVRQTPKTPKLLPTPSQTEYDERDISSSEIDISWEADVGVHATDVGCQVKDGQVVGTDVGEEMSATVPEFDTESWDISRLDQDFEKCLASLESGSLEADAALGWLDGIEEAFSDVKVYIGWYRCRVAAHKMTGDSNAVLADFEQAIINNVQPAEQMARLLTQTMKDMLTWQRKPRKGRKSVASASKPTGSASRKRRPSQIQEENMFESTTVKYSVVEVTPFKKRRRVTEAGDKIIPVITPVRRSARISMAKGAASEGRLQRGTAKNTEYTALRDVPSSEKEKMLFQPNKALDILLSDDSPDQEDVF
ncbi:hypothetical protein BaRGS_00032020 [Batillaria attramentaria]|uniref:Uncharacterized protein n=1 Tax=Batillaria attramentaria TaxID=370345 RepID=A0ABD0JP89_9CAEN